MYIVSKQMGQSHLNIIYFQKIIGFIKNTIANHIYIYWFASFKVSWRKSPQQTFFKQNSVFIDIYIYFVTIVKAVESVNLNVN